MRKRNVFMALSVLAAPLISLNAAELGYSTLKGMENTEAAGDADWLSLSIGTGFNSSRAQAKLDADLRFYTGGDGEYLYSIPEAYYEFKNRNTDIAVGRKLIDWSKGDSYWGLGIHNGLQGFNLSRDKEEGLVGIHVERRMTNRLKLNLFASTIHVPSLNPGYKEEDGQLSSVIPWTWMPPKTMNLMDSNIPINYEIGDYDVAKIVLQQSFGANLNYNWRSGMVNAYAMYKPENNLRINAEGKLQNDLEHVKVVATPQVNHHLVMGLGATQKLTRRISIGGGFEYIDPNTDLTVDVGVLDPTVIKNNDRRYDTKYFKIEPTYQRQAYSYLSANYDASYFKVGLSHIYNFAEDPEKSGDDVFGDQIKWHNAIGGKIDYDFNDNLSMLFDYKYDFKMKDAVLKNEISYRFLNSMSVSVGVELIKAPSETSYWSMYREHDTFYSNFGYSF